MSNSENQPELFKELSGAADKSRPRRRSLRPLFLERKFTFNTEQVIIFLICVVMLGVITFSLGVQKSRSYESRREQIEAVTKKLSASLQDLSSGVKSAAKKPASLKENAIAKSAVAPALVSNSLRTVHTVQVASFKKKDYAKQEAEWLNSRGYSAMIINGKDYFLVCIGKYASLAEADKALNKIKKEFKQYQDCYVRKL